MATIFTLIKMASKPKELWLTSMGIPTTSIKIAELYGLTVPLSLVVLPITLMKKDMSHHLYATPLFRTRMAIGLISKIRAN